MKIGIDARFFGPESKGLGRYTQQLITHLTQYDRENEYVIFLHRENFVTYKPPHKNITKVCANYKWYSWAEQLFFPRLLYKYHCDIVHFPHFNVPLLYWKPFVVTVHDLILLRFPTREGSTRGRLTYWLKYIMYRIVIRHALFAARHIITVSAFTKRDLLSQYHLPSPKITVTYEAASIIHHTMRPMSRTDLEQHQGITGQYMLYVGNAYPHKNLTTLIEAYALWQKLTKRDNVSLVLVGRDDYFYNRLEEKISATKVSKIHILHTVDDATLQALYQYAKLFVFPSLYEGFGLPPLEACAYGTPVLSSRTSCMQEILGSAVAYTDVSDPIVFARDMEKLLSDEQLRATLRQKGPRQAQKYSWEQTARQTGNIYKKVASMV